MDPSNPGATKPMFWKYVRNCLNKDCLGPSLKVRKSQFCHAAAKKCCGSGNDLICESLFKDPYPSVRVYRYSENVIVVGMGIIMSRQ